VGLLGGDAAARIGRQHPSSRPVRVALAAPRDEAPIRATTRWHLLDRQRRVIVRGAPGDAWIVQRDPGRVRAAGPGGSRTAWYDGPATLEPADSSGYVQWNGRPFRGVLVYVPADTALLVVNRVDVEEYLRGVVAIEAGTRAPDEHAAVEAQAVAARSFTYTRMLYAAARDYDLTASTSDQVYAGINAETFIGDLAVAATAGWVLSALGRIVDAPYHAVCGGHTALPTEVWRTSSDSYLRGVSDRVPGTERAWCDIAPRFRWERRLAATALSAAIDRYARSYATLPSGGSGVVRAVDVDSRTASGRASAVTITTERGQVRLRGNDMRYVLRDVGGEILFSTYFSLEPEADADGHLARVVVRGQGHGHGVGLCQWGAIGRARAGQDFREILRAYYPAAQLVRAP
jgi:stage II sporulation protein D